MKYKDHDINIDRDLQHCQSVVKMLDLFKLQEIMLFNKLIEWDLDSAMHLITKLLDKENNVTVRLGFGQRSER